MSPLFRALPDARMQPTRRDVAHGVLAHVPVRPPLEGSLPAEPADGGEAGPPRPGDEHRDGPHVEPALLQGCAEGGPEGARGQDGRDEPAAPYSGTTTAPPATSSTQTRFATASTASLRSVPARSSPRATKAPVPASAGTVAMSTPAGTGRQPSARRSRRGPRPARPRRPARASVRPASRPGAAERRGAEQPEHAVAAVEAVPMAWPVNAVEMIASASTPGATTSMRRCGPRSAPTASGEPDEQQRRQHEGQQHLLAVAQQDPGVEPGLREHAPGAGAGRGSGSRSAAGERAVRDVGRAGAGVLIAAPGR